MARMGESPLQYLTMKYSSSGAGYGLNKAVKLTSNLNEVIETSASVDTDVFFGLTDENVTAVATGGPQELELKISGLSYAVVSEAVSIGDFLVLGTSGKLKKFRGLNGSIGLRFVVARALQASSTDGDTILVEICKFYAKDEEREVISGATLSATGDIGMFAPRHKCTIQAVKLLVKTTITANDTDYWTFTMTNNTGTVTLLASSDANTTKATNGSGITAYTLRSLTLHGSNSLVIAAGDVCYLTATKSGSAANLVDPKLVVDYQLALS